MEQHTHEPTSDTVRAAARLLGRLAGRAGDSYDVLESFAAGWAAQVAGEDDSALGAAHTTRSQAGGAAGAIAEPNFTADQAKPAPVSREQLRLQLAVLADLRAAVESVIEWRVQDAREQRWSWAEVAEPLEITKQGAHKRYEVDRIRVTGAPKV